MVEDEYINLYFPDKQLHKHVRPDSIGTLELIFWHFSFQEWSTSVGETRKDASRVRFDRTVKLGSHGTKAGSDAGVPAYPYRL